MEEKKILLPAKVSRVIGVLQAHGYEAYAVGGCVRDSLLGRRPEDWDVTTSAAPQEIKALFPRTFDTGILHGTVTVLLGRERFEVTTYRIDGKYEDGRHPKEVTFTRNLKEDLLRRDFTINAMAYNETEGLVDIFGGMADLQMGTIRCVGDAKARFSEDALRILRGVRFAAQLGFGIEEETEKGMRALAPSLQKISAERIQAELVKILVSRRPAKLRKAYELGVTAQFLPEFDRMMETTQETPHHCYTVGEHTLRALEEVRADKILRLAALFHDMAKPLVKTMDGQGKAHFYGHDRKGKELAETVLGRLKFDNRTINRVAALVEAHDYRAPATEQNVRRAMNRIGEELFEDYCEIRRADIMAQSTYRRREKLENLDETERIYRRIKEQGQCVSLSSLAVKGRDLIDAGMQPGKEIGEKLNELLGLVLEDPKKNTKEELMKHIFPEKNIP